MGLNVNPNARNVLKELYADILQKAHKMNDCGYKQSLMQLSAERIELLNSNADDSQVEQTIGMGQLEELIEQAKEEQRLIKHFQDLL